MMMEDRRASKRNKGHQNTPLVSKLTNYNVNRDVNRWDGVVARYLLGTFQTITINTPMPRGEISGSVVKCERLRG